MLFKIEKIKWFQKYWKYIPKILPGQNQTKTTTTKAPLKQKQLHLPVGLNSSLQVFLFEWGSAWVDGKTGSLKNKTRKQQRKTPESENWRHA